ncbi:MAG TPA: hypothetical protein VGM30_14790 [Puia sp.]|jgi:hypothetical protein
MKSLFIAALLILLWSFLAPDPVFIDPTGTYVLTGFVKKNRITGHSGELRVRLLDRRTVAVCFYINKGYPGYESGAFADTLDYVDNKISWSPSKDSSCLIVFFFAEHLVEVREIYSDPHSGCGFGQGVVVPAIFNKSSSDIPVIQDLSAHGVSS